MACRSRGVVPHSPIPAKTRCGDDDDAVYNALNAVSSFPTCAVYELRGGARRQRQRQQVFQPRQGVGHGAHRWVRLAPLHPGARAPPAHAGGNTEDDEEEDSDSSSPHSRCSSRRRTSSLCWAMTAPVGQMRSGAAAAAGQAEPAAFSLQEDDAKPARSAARVRSNRPGDSIALRPEKVPPFERPTFLAQLHAFLHTTQTADELSPLHPGAASDESTEGARDGGPRFPAQLRRSSTFSRRESSILRRNDSVRLSVPDVRCSSLKRRTLRADAALTAALDAIAAVREDLLTAEAALLVREAEELRDLEERERMQRLVLLDEQVTSLRDRMRYEDFVVLHRQFHRFAGSAGELRLSRIPKSGWHFCGNTITGAVARKLDRNHSGALDFFEVLRYLYPGMAYQDVQRSIAAFGKRFREENRERQALTLHRMGYETINDYARSFLAAFSAEERQDATKPKWLTLERLASIVSAPDELVPMRDVEALFARHCKHRGGVCFLDLECFVAALYRFPRVWGV